MDSAGKCIYCKRSGIPFSREHVIPQAFGTFGSKTVVLTDAVCAECNLRLGRELDEITLYKSAGIAIQDVVAAQLVYRKAIEKRVGAEVEI